MPPPPSAVAVVAKLCGDAIAHKTERGLVRLGLAGADETREAAAELFAAARPDDGEVQVLVAPMVKATRELIAGLNVDAQFGPTVVLGVGGILAEAVADAVVRLVPISEVDAEDMLDELASQALLGPFRGEPRGRPAGGGRRAARAVRRRRARARPVLGRPEPADDRRRRAGGGRRPGRAGRAPRSPLMPTQDHFRALFDPRGVIVAGASTHPGKFGFVALHNILANGYGGEVFATNREGVEVLGRPTLGSIDEVPDGAADLVFVCTPAGANPEVLRQAAAKGVKAAFIASAGYGESGEEGQVAPGRARGPRRRPRHADRRAQRAGPGLHPVVAVRADRGAVPAPGPHRRRQPVRQLRVVVPEPLAPVGRRREPGRVGRQRRPGGRARRPRVLRRRPRDHASASPTSRACPTAVASSSASPPSPSASRSWC